MVSINSEVDQNKVNSMWNGEKKINIELDHLWCPMRSNYIALDPSNIVLLLLLLLLLLF